MQKIVTRGLYGLLFAGGITLLGATAAHAADTTGEDGIASGNLVDAPISLPITLDGNAISVIGDSTAGSPTAGGGAAQGGTTSAAASEPAVASTSGEDGIGSGNVVSPDVAAPVAATGNSITLIGDSTTLGSSSPGSDADGTSIVTPSPSTEQATSTTGEDGIASGNLISPDLMAPMGVSDNAIAAIGGPVLVEPVLVGPVVGESMESSTPGGAEASDRGIVRARLPLFASPVMIDAGIGAAASDVGTGPGAVIPGVTDPGATGPETSDPAAPDPDAGAPGFTSGAVTAAGSGGAVLASSTTPTASVLAHTGANPAELLLLALALLFGGATAGLLWRVNRS